jgi:hypothetical protein
MPKLKANTSRDTNNREGDSDEPRTLETDDMSRRLFNSAFHKCQCRSVHLGGPRLLFLD